MNFVAVRVVENFAQTNQPDIIIGIQRNAVMCWSCLFQKRVLEMYHEKCRLNPHWGSYEYTIYRKDRL